MTWLSSGQTCHLPLSSNQDEKELACDGKDKATWPLQDDLQQSIALDIFNTLQSGAFEGEGQAFALAALCAEIQDGSLELAGTAVKLFLRLLQSAK